MSTDALVPLRLVHRRLTRPVAWLCVVLLMSAAESQAQTRRIAVMPFNGVGLAPQDKSFADNVGDMLATNLAESKDIQIVERTQIKKAFEALKIDSSSAIDQETATKVGGWLGATHVVVGTLAAVGDRVRLDSRVVSLQAGVVEKSARAEGTRKDLFELVNTLSSRVLSAMTGEAIAFSEVSKTILDKAFTMTIPDTNSAARFVSQPLFEGRDPAVVVSFAADYDSGALPIKNSGRGRSGGLTGLLGQLGAATGIGTSFSNASRVQLLVNNAPVATWTASQANMTSTVQQAISIDGVPATITIETQRVTAVPVQGSTTARRVASVAVKVNIQRQAP